jgi:hypothetical protein
MKPAREHDEKNPVHRMHELLGGYRTTQMLFVAARLGLADELADGPRSVSQLAAATASHPPALLRLLRALSSLGIFTERPEGTFELTVLADTLRADAPNSLRPVALSYGESWWWDAFGELMHSVKTGETGFRRAHGMELFEYLNQHDDAACVFNANMSATTCSESQAVIDSYPFAYLKCLVDVGGGQGTLAAAILQSHLKARAIIFDQPSIIEGACALLERAGILTRCTLVSGSFFDTIPAKGDTYTLKDILHNWNDEQCITILRNIRQAMSGEARLLVIERIITPGNQESAGKITDITMLVMTGGRERTENEYQHLLQQANFTISRIIPASAVSVIEALPI